MRGKRTPPLVDHRTDLISQLLRSYLTNFVLPACLADATLDSIYEFNFCDAAVAVTDSELGIGTATRLLLEEEADSIEGRRSLQNSGTALK